MGENSAKITAQAMETYRATARGRWEQEQQALAQRRAQAWQVARAAAAFLKERYGATQVRLFGSLAHQRWFSMTSDLDLAAWGLNAADFFEVVGRLQDLSPAFEIDLVMMERCRADLRQIIEREGVIL